MSGLNLSFMGPEHVELMNQQINHRGTRSHIWHDDFISIGYVRLPVQDSNSKFDMPYQYKNWIIAFVGEIYNQKKITQSDYSSDVEVMALAWDQMGPKAFELFDGMWAAVIYNKQKRELFTFTDHLAKKPLYYRDRPFAISSEIKALTHHPYVRDHYYFASTGKSGYCNRDHVFDYHITKMRPGAYNHISPFNHQATQYLQLCPVPPEDLVGTIREAVHNRLIGDLPIALLWSGGLGSSIILHHILEVTQDVTVFHIKNSGDRIHDLPEGVKLVTLDVEYVDIPEALYWNEGPADLGSLLPRWTMARAIADYGFHVVLSGYGVEQVFGAYSKYDPQYAAIFDDLLFCELPQLDKLFMSQMIELRCPFLAPNVIKAGLALDFPDRINKGELRRLYKDFLPDVVKKPKVAFVSHRERYQLIDEFEVAVVPKYYLNNTAQKIKRMIEKGI